MTWSFCSTARGRRSTFVPRRASATRTSAPTASGWKRFARRSTRASSSNANHELEWSRQQLLHHLAVYVGQPIVAALEAVRQLLVVEAQQLEDGRLQVVDVNA